MELNRNPKIETELLEKNFLFSSPFSISHSDQKDLISMVLDEGETLPPEENVEPFWLGMGLTELKDPSLLLNVSQENQGWWHYLSRLDPEIDWVWKNHKGSEIVQRVLQPLAPFYDRFTRVTLVIQRPGMALPAHRDIVVGQTYQNMDSEFSTGWGNKELLFKGKEWFSFNPKSISDSIHQKQYYLNLKIPLSQNPESPGAPFVIWGDRKILYSSENHAFFLNEALIEHGGDPCPYYRGVVFVDGFLNIEKFKEFPKMPVKVLDVVKL